MGQSWCERRGLHPVLTLKPVSPIHHGLPPTEMRTGALDVQCLPGMLPQLWQGAWKPKAAVTAWPLRVGVGRGVGLSPLRPLWQSHRPRRPSGAKLAVRSGRGRCWGERAAEERGLGRGQPAVWPVGWVPGPCPPPT